MRGLPLLLSLALLGGCAGFSADGGFGPVQQSARNHLDKELRWARSEAERAAIRQRVAELLAQPLDAEAAVQLALLNNRGLQASFFELGIGEADFVQAGRLPNPGISLASLQRGDEHEIERGLHLNLARLLALPWTGQLEARRFEQSKQRVALEVLSLAAETRKAWIAAVATEQARRYAAQVMEAAEAGAELARRMAQVGNFSALQRAREQGFYADAALGLARAEQLQRSARERLTRQLGLWGEQAASFALPERLPDLPAQADELPEIERIGMARRLDVQGARLASEALARQLGLSRVTRMVNVLELGLVRNSSNLAPTQRGWELSLELPLFDWGQARVARAESQYLQALERVAETAINARSELREAYGNYRSAHAIAQHHRQELVPLRQRIAEENLLRYNGMLIGVFELLADTRAQIASVAAAIDAQRDFWLAKADLDQALLGKPGLARAGAITATPAAADSGGH
ncbi:TolC family protein [Paucibacter soli]|uniref:TolC family protein n=1 Tax=Paucibacter soli TaxID=3133433 RepID=UPI0030A9AA71